MTALCQQGARSTATAPLPRNPHSILRHSIQCHEDILRTYRYVKSLSGENGYDEMIELWASSTVYAASKCKEISEWQYSTFAAERSPPCTIDRKWCKKINNNVGWKTYSTKAMRVTRCSCVAKSWDGLEAVLNELANTAHAIEDLRVHCVLDHWFDPGEWSNAHGNPNILLLSTSDSCVTDEDDDAQYFRMRARLHEFQNDRDREWMKTDPIPQARMRKDLRAWARLARYGCIRLPCNSMLIHKDKDRLPRRDRKKRNVGFREETDQQSSRARSPTPVGVDGSTWKARCYVPFVSSAESMASQKSAESNGSSSKKRRLPRSESGYTCDFSGCDKTFDRQCDLTHHQRSHRPKDTLPYPCEDCPARFGFAKDLRRHKRTHRAAEELDNAFKELLGTREQNGVT